MDQYPIIADYVLGCLSQVFLSLRFDEDIGKDETEEEKVKPKKNKRWQKNQEVPKQLPVNDKKKTRQELISKAREEVTSDQTLFIGRLCEFI